LPRLILVAATLSPRESVPEGRVRGLDSDMETVFVAHPPPLEPGDAPWSEVMADDAPSPLLPACCGDDLAYVLYTSGSTGKPKGVMLSHANAFTFLDWCDEALGPRPDDRFSSHAPFHFDLSILDLYVPMRVGAAVILIGTDQGKEPQGLAALIADRRLTIWYSTPTILSLLTQYGKMERHDYSSIRIAFFAGEVFPVKHLRSIVQRWPGVRFYNLYGPTETNVCTWHPIPREIPEDRTTPYPIGQTCSHFEARVVDATGEGVARGSEGELVMHGLGTMAGYWNLPERSANAFFIDDDGRRWYRTGDVVTEDEHGVFTYVGRRDRMVKRRGYRIELGEVESALYRHAAIKEAAVVAHENGAGVRITAFVCLGTGHEPSIVAMKRFCAEALPNYMSPDSFVFIDALPKTSTDKIDYQKLVGQV
jgi:amino acid adenylation domain-containing protein